VSLKDFVSVVITTDNAPRAESGDIGVAKARDHDPDVQASAHGWRCLDLNCPARAPRRGPTPPRCYTCGRAMTLVYAPPLKTEQELAPYVASGVLTAEAVWEATRRDEMRSHDAKASLSASEKVDARFPGSANYADSI
jgi:hypothetical protein